MRVPFDRQSRLVQLARPPADKLHALCRRLFYVAVTRAEALLVRDSPFNNKQSSG